MNELKDTPPLVIRFMGTKHLEGIEILRKENIDAFKDIIDAVNKIKEFLSRE
jgi:succinyl-CoA synthetase beta subunit